jgi:hypothetical protein
MLDVSTGECRKPMTEMEMAMAFKEVTDKFERDHKVSLSVCLSVCPSVRREGIKANNPQNSST